MELAHDNAILQVPGSPAEGAGLRIGAQIVSVDGRPVAEIHGTPAWSRLIERDHVEIALRGDGEATRTVAVFEVIPAARPASTRGSGR